MKKTVILLAIMLVWATASNAGELKVQIPVADYEKIQSRLDALEGENSRLKQEISSLESSSSTPPPVQQAVNTEPSEEMLAKLSSLEKENDQLKNQIDSLQNSRMEDKPVVTNSELEDRLAALESENIQLSQKIKSYKERGVRVVDNDRRTARQVYRDMLMK